mmetsp:Transcript_49314/g.99287  ORF Transcript_49314/g.99287 Transcript_49314/m.99287 type:complete len:100 (-) Transcript_49314:134-433(-)
MCARRPPEEGGESGVDGGEVGEVGGGDVSADDACGVAVAAADESLAEKRDTAGGSPAVEKAPPFVPVAVVGGSCFLGFSGEKASAAVVWRSAGVASPSR